MFVVAGPAGSGKSSFFPLSHFGVDFFTVDDRAAELHGSYEGISPEARAQAGRDCEAFIRDHIEARRSFAVETTLRTEVSLAQARAAHTAGFATILVYVGTDDPAINVERVRLRGLQGKHSAPATLIRDIYAASLANLRRACAVFDVVRIYDNSGPVAEHPEPVAFVDAGVVRLPPGAPAWIADALGLTHTH